MTFVAGEKCFAKVKGYPPWPARINVLPPDVKVPRGKYPIFFYGTYEVCFLPANAIFPYEKFKMKYGTPRITAGFNKGLEELENNSTILQYGFDPEAVNFLDQFYDFSLPSDQAVATNEISTQEKRNSLDSDLVSESSSPNVDKSPQNKDSMSPSVSESKEVKEPSNEPSEASRQEVLQDPQCCDEKHEILEHPTCIVDKEVLEQTQYVDEKQNPLMHPNVNDAKHEVLEEKPEVLDVNIDENAPLAEDYVISNDVEMTETLKVENKEETEAENGHIEEYANDFTQLLMEIRKYSLSKARKSQLKKMSRKNRLDSRIRLFYPWYDSPKKK